MDNELRIVQGNTFATAIEIHAVDATGQPIVDWSLDDSTDLRVWYVFAGREQDITTWSIENGKVVILWLANQQRVGAYDIFVDGVFNGGQWRNAMQYQFRIVRFNHEANIPSNVIILDGIYQLSAEMAIITRMFDNRGTPSNTTPNMDGEAEVGTEERYARGDHRHPSDTSKQDVIADLATIRSGAEAGATAYQKPANGIPSTDLTSDVQTSLGKADTAVQPAAIADMATETYVDGAVFDEETRAKGVENALQDAINTKQDTISDLSTIRSGAAAGATAYQKPSTGIPKTDLASAVQTSLGKADTALQQSNIVDSLNSSSTDAPLSANQGRILNETKQDTLTFDNVPTSGSDNPVKSGGVYDAIEDVDAKLDDYAKIDGAYEGMLAGNAMNLVDTTGTPILREFVFSKSGGSEQIATGTALIKRLRGNTIVWNQLLKTFAEADIKPASEGYSTCVYSEQKVTLTGWKRYTPYRFNAKLSERLNHKLYLRIDANITSTAVQVQLGESSNRYYLTNGKDSRIIVCANLGNGIQNNISIFHAEPVGTVIDAVFNNFMCIDLTQMFGAGNEPTSVAEFESLFPLDYYEYNAGQLLSFNGSGLKTIGFNQWDEEWELGYYGGGNGNKFTSNEAIRSKNFIKALPNTSYYVCKPSNYGTIQVNKYRADKSFIDRVYISSSFTTDADCHYITFNTLTSNNITTYNHDICINLSDTSKNGTYEPYVVNTKDISFYKSIKDANDNILFPYGLLSAGSVYDEVTENKGIKRIGRQLVTGAIGDTITLVGCNTSATTYKCASNIGTLSSGVLTLTAAVTDIEVLFELATPIEVDIEEQNLAYQVDGGGTEQLLPENTSTPTTTPARLDVNYGLDAMATLKNLQKNYLAQTDLDRLLTAEGYTYTKTWDATNNQWNFTISGNSKYYSKPSGGIPSTDLDSAVQTSLGKADTSLQPSDVVDSLSSSSTTEALSANQGKVLNDGKQDKIDSTHKLSADLVDDASTTNKFVTSSEKTTWNGKANKVLVNNHGTDDTTYSVTPNTLHIWGTVASLTLTLATPTDNTIVNEYMIEFTSGSTATTLSLPSSVEWAESCGTLSVEASKTYQVSIVNNIGLWASISNS